MKNLLLVLVVCFQGAFACSAQQGYAAQPGSYMYGIVVNDGNKSVYITNIVSIGNYQNCEGSYGKAEPHDCAAKSLWEALQNEVGSQYQKYHGGIKTFLNTHSGYGAHEYFLTIDEAQKELDKAVSFYRGNGYVVGKLRL